MRPIFETKTVKEEEEEFSRLFEHQTMCSDVYVERVKEKRRKTPAQKESVQKSQMKKDRVKKMSN